MIVIKDYDPGWIADFEQLHTDLLDVLGPLALRVDHIGSTSVPGLGAKDVIDIQVTVGELTDRIVKKMVNAGFEHKPQNSSDHVPAGEDENPKRWEKLFFNQRPGERRANIHVRVQGNLNQRYALLFRDYLRTHPHSAATVERIKRALAKHHAEDIDAYYDIKDPVYDLIWDAAQEWAKTNGWKLE